MDQTFDRIAVLRYIVDARRGIMYPVGLVGWNAGRPRGDFAIRILSDVEEVDTYDLPLPDDWRVLTGHTCEHLLTWMRSGVHPYQGTDEEAFSDDWWRGVKALLMWSVWLSTPLAVSPDASLERHFEDLVLPWVPREEAERDR